MATKVKDLKIICSINQSTNLTNQSMHYGEVAMHNENFQDYLKGKCHFNFLID